VDAGYEEARELLETEFTAERILGMATSQVTATAMELASRLPSLRDATFGWLDQYQKGRFVVTVDTSDLERGLTSIGSVSRNLTIGLITAGQLIALALVLAVLIMNDTLDSTIVTLVTLAFVGFLGFSLLMIRRVTRPPH
jgi:hypothetical protein